MTRGNSLRIEPEPDVGYYEFHAGSEPSPRSALVRDAVVLSNIEHGVAETQPAQGLCVRYVARGSENYRIGGRGYRLGAGQVMIAPQEAGADCEIRRVDSAGTLGLCSLIRGATDDLEWVFGPLIVDSGCSSVGPMLRSTVQTLWNASRPKNDVAWQLVSHLRSELPKVAASLLSQAAAVDGAKPGTRFEAVRRANLAQAYLHSTTDRAVDLNELAAAVGASPFRLLASFQRCFSETPATYHRKLRLKLVIDESKRRQVAIGAVCDEFGFADLSSFSHAYRRAFGSAPVWQKA